MAGVEIARHLQEIIFAFGHFSKSLWGSGASIWCGRQYNASDNKKHSKKLLPFPSSLLWLLNLVQKELTSKGCSRDS